MAMQKMNHPDFIEIDAASHTGVDNVRSIIDAASFIPVLGKKKIYLIDEAHMLSKAAFNAFLKILEEPPTSVVFMLATTDPHKILETVTSRCFQLFFDPIDAQAVTKHLAAICAKEDIAFEEAALALIAQETEGSLRDALNLVERIRIAYPSISLQAVTDLLGKIDDERLCELLKVVVQGSAPDILGALKKFEIAKYNPIVVWKSFVEIIRQALWIKNGVALHEGELKDGNVGTALKQIADTCTIERLIALFEICYDYELAFAKTATPGTMLEMMLLKMAIHTEHHTTQAQGTQAPALKGSIKSTLTPVKQKSVEQTVRQTDQIGQAGVADSMTAHLENTTNSGSAVIENKLENSEIIDANGIHSDTPATALSGQSMAAKENSDDPVWTQCLQEIEKLNDPLVVSIFKQGVVGTYDGEAKTLAISFFKRFTFF